MSKRINQKYTPEYRVRAVNMVISSDKSVAKIASELGMNVTTLYTWVNQEKSASSPKNKVTNDELFNELNRLKKELVEVKEQRDILKKATAYFANESR